jgi:hypothetical protein
MLTTEAIAELDETNPELLQMAHMGLFAVRKLFNRHAVA